MSEKTIKLPSGATVVLRDPQSLIVKDRNKIYEASEGKEGVMQALALTNAIVACLVKEWSFDLLPPSVKAESLEELSIADYDALVEESADAQEVIFPSFSKTLQNEADPKADTANSNA